jgi:hypothetical protein
MTETEKACEFFDGCHRNGATIQDLLYYIGVLLCNNNTNSLAPVSLPYGADFVEKTYVGSTNNVQTEIYRTGGSGGTIVATLTYTYVAAGVADNDDIETITRT